MVRVVGWISVHFWQGAPFRIWSIFNYCLVMLVQFKSVDELFLVGWVGSPQGEFIPLRDEFGSCFVSFALILFHVTILSSRTIYLLYRSQFSVKIDS